jgi:hypothetical protein
MRAGARRFDQNGGFRVLLGINLVRDRCENLRHETTKHNTTKKRAHIPGAIENKAHRQRQ